MLKEDYENEAAKIANEGLDYYLVDYGATVNDPKLQKLYDAGEKSLKAIYAYFETKGVNLEEY
jgi:hypothetical protein